VDGRQGTFGLLERVPWWAVGAAGALVLAVLVLADGSLLRARDRGPLLPEPGMLSRTSPELLARLRAEAFTYFRFVNRPWIGRVCAAFAADLASLPVVRVHGDAHVEQFAFTQDAWGLDDFDDTAQGSAVIDIMRYLGSVDLAARERGWRDHRDPLFDRFFEGYRRGLAQPEYVPPAPDVVRRLRAQPPGSRASFLLWAEAQMQPMAEESIKAVVAGMDAFSGVVRTERPELSAEYFDVSRVGWLRMGVGSAGDTKILIRVQGVSVDPADDELLEARELGYFGGLGCLQEPPSTALRIILGNRQLGRLKHNILAAGPDLVIPELLVQGRQMRQWWIRSWDSTYREVRLTDLRTVKDLEDLVYDAGVQLGGGSIQEQAPSASVRKQMLASIVALEHRLREEAVVLVDDVLRGWRQLAG
jgi:hypothetical protein